ncbi:MAG: hypothetical protein KGN36_05675, partial [Acidobacteriota bacterium]|nr:hypothetical protein [Acidobacteriota bacterium]
MRLTAILILFAALLCLLAQPVWADKGYRLTLAGASKIGAVELQPGDYTLHLHDDGVVLSDIRTREDYKFEAKVDTGAERKFA